jgi:hypothetical protein
LNANFGVCFCATIIRFLELIIPQLPHFETLTYEYYYHFPCFAIYFLSSSNYPHKHLSLISPSLSPLPHSCQPNSSTPDSHLQIPQYLLFKPTIVFFNTAIYYFCSACSSFSFSTLDNCWLSF